MFFVVAHGPARPPHGPSWSSEESFVVRSGLDPLGGRNLRRIRWFHVFRVAVVLARGLVGGNRQTEWYFFPYMSYFRCANPGDCGAWSNKTGFGNNGKGYGLPAHIDVARLPAGAKVCNACYYDCDPANRRWPADYYVLGGVRPSRAPSSSVGKQSTCLIEPGIWNANTTLIHTHTTYIHTHAH